jgi:nucleoid-associated protein YgaU
MALVGNSTEEKIWNFLKGKGLNNFGAAGLMGNLFAESGLNPQNLQNTFEKKLGHTDASYTAAVDGGTYTNFVHDSAGYGLAQWTYWSRKQNMLAYHKAAGTSIGDLETQLNFLIKELSESYGSVFSVLKTATSVRTASNSVLLNFERPADTGSTVQAKRAGYGQTYYDKYAKAANAAGATTGGNGKMTEAEARQKVVKIMQGWIGCKESDGSHKKIIDIYNTYKPHPRGYTLQYTDAWCAGTVSAAAIQAGYTDIMPVECSCHYLIEEAKKLGIWQEKDNYTPSIGDEVLYDWQDGTNYATTDNTGDPDHVGMVESVNGSTFIVIEGNKNDAVERRTMQVNGRYIRGFICPKYSKKATGTATTQTGSGTTATATTTTTTKATETSQSLKVGDEVQFTGTKHYTSANATSGKTCKPGKAKITQIYKTGRHPYHLIAVKDGGSTVYGWVDGADIATAAVKTYTVKKGDSLWNIAAKQLGNATRYKEIQKLNGLTSDIIQVGQVLKLPN